MAIQCSATDNHLSNAVATGFTLATEPYSIVCWIKGTWSSGATGSFVGMYGPATPTTALQIGRRGAAGTGTLACWTWGGGILISTTGMVDGVWNHIAYTFDGTNHRLYVDGTLVNTTATAQLAGQFTTVFINGYPGGVTSEVSDHQVDSYAYYNRALSDGEIHTMADANGARHGIVYGLIAAYEFDEGVAGSTVSAVKDMSGNGNDLTPSGAGASPTTYAYTGAVASSNIRRMH